MKSLIQEKVNLNLPLITEEENFIYRTRFNHHINQLKKDVDHYYKIPELYKTDEIIQIAKELFRLKEVNKESVQRIPEEFKTDEILLTKMRYIVHKNERYESYRISYLNNLFKKYPESTKTQENIEYFLKNGGSLKHVNRKQLSSDIWNIAIKNNKNSIIPLYTINNNTSCFISLFFIFDNCIKFLSFNRFNCNYYYAFYYKLFNMFNITIIYVRINAMKINISY